MSAHRRIVFMALSVLIVSHLSVGCSESPKEAPIEKAATSLSRPQRPPAALAAEPADLRAEEVASPVASSEFVAPGAVIIDNTGSTNTYGYQILISRYGHVVYTNGTRHGEDDLPDALSAKLFSDLQAAMPLSDHAQGTCPKSASFGTTTSMQYRGQRSPDLSCPTDKQIQALYNDVMAIDQYLNVTNYPRRTS